MVASRPLAFQSKQDNWLTNHEVIEAPWASCGSSLLPSLQARGAAYPWCTCQVARSRSFFPMPTATLAVNTYPLPFQSEDNNVSNNQSSKHLKSSHSTPMRPETAWNLLNLHLWSNFQDVPKHYKTNGFRIAADGASSCHQKSWVPRYAKRKRDGFTCTDLLCVFSRSPKKKNMSTREFKFLSLPFVKQINMSLTYSRRHFFQNNQFSWGNYTLWMPVALPQQLDPTGGAKHWKIALQCPRSASTIWPGSLLNYIEFMS